MIVAGRGNLAEPGLLGGAANPLSFPAFLRLRAQAAPPGTSPCCDGYSDYPKGKFAALVGVMHFSVAVTRKSGGKTKKMEKHLREAEAKAKVADRNLKEGRE